MARPCIDCWFPFYTERGREVPPSERIPLVHKRLAKFSVDYRRRPGVPEEADGDLDGDTEYVCRTHLASLFEWFMEEDYVLDSYEITVRAISHQSERAPNHTPRA